MAWPAEGVVSSHNGIVTETAITPWIEQKENELHRVIVERKDPSPTQVAFIEVWGTLDKVLIPTNFTYDMAIEASTLVFEFPVFGFRWFAIGAHTAAGADSILLDVDYVGNKG